MFFARDPALRGRPVPVGGGRAGGPHRVGVLRRPGQRAGLSRRVRPAVDRRRAVGTPPAEHDGRGRRRRPPRCCAPGAWRGGTIAVELPFLPADAFAVLRGELPGATFVDATPALADVRAVKRPGELERLEVAHRRVAEAIRATFVAGRADDTLREVAAAVQRGVEERGADVPVRSDERRSGPDARRDLRAVGPRPSAAHRRGRRGRRLSRGRRPHGVDRQRAGPRARDVRCVRPRAGRHSRAPGARRGVQRPVADRHRRHRRRPHWALWEVPGPRHRSGEPRAARDHARRATAVLEPGMVVSVETDYLDPETGHIKLEDSVVVSCHGVRGARRRSPRLVHGRRRVAAAVRSSVGTSARLSDPPMVHNAARGTHLVPRRSFLGRTRRTRGRSRWKGGAPCGRSPLRSRSGSSS